MVTRVVAAAAAMLLLAGCPSGTPGASPELASAFAFAAYPNGRLIETDVYPDTVFVIPGPGVAGQRIYETTDTREQVSDYYRRLADANGWTFSGPVADYAPDFATLQRTRFDIRIGSDAPPSPSPSPGASPAPAPAPSPWRLRVTVNVSR